MNAFAPRAPNHESCESDELLPRLRDDLKLHHAPPSSNGAPAWLLEDPVRMRFFRIPANLFSLLHLWQAKSRQELEKNYREQHGREPEPNSIEALKYFLTANELTQEPEKSGWSAFSQRADMQTRSALKILMHSYLFFRIPLVHPQRFIDWSWPLISWLFTRSFAYFSCLCGLIGLWLVARQWDVFANTFMNFFTLEGIALYGGSLVVIKSFHELGHAFMAKKYKVPVPVIGVALVVLMPVLYTDTSSAWRVSTRQRLMIDGAGIMVELVIACFATMAWAFLPEGPMRQIAFATATVSWIMSLSVNLNPLMRFDGYYIFSDAIGIPNLQERGFALARWRLREWLFGWGDQVPEIFTKTIHRSMIIHAFATWIYRFFLFLGIALLVYHFAFKVLGIILFLIEIIWFIILPIIRELTIWHKRRQSMSMNFSSIRTFIIIMGILAAFFIPWQTSIKTPALLRAGEVRPIFSPANAQISAIHIRNGEKIKTGQLLYELNSPDLTNQMKQLELKLDIAQKKLSRLVALREELSQRLILERERDALRKELEHLTSLNQQLKIYANLSGMMANVDPNLHAGLWISPTTPLGTVINTDTTTLTALVEESAISRLKLGASGTFIAQEPELKAMDFHVTHIAQTNIPTLELAPLDAAYDGAVLTSSDKNGEKSPTASWYRVDLTLSEPMPAPRTEMRGTAHIHAQSQSIASRISTQVVGVLLRESGF